MEVNNIMNNTINLFQTQTSPLTPSTSFKNKCLGVLMMGVWLCLLLFLTTSTCVCFLLTLDNVYFSLGTDRPPIVMVWISMYLYLIIFWFLRLNAIIIIVYFILFLSLSLFLLFLHIIYVCFIFFFILFP